MKRIVQVPHTVLSTPAKTVTVFDKSLARLITEMTDVLIATDNPKGVGLAAPQIGVPLRVFLIRPNEKTPIRVFINPEIIERSTDVTDGVPQRSNKLEGCLSIPGIWGKVRRLTRITLNFRDIEGREHAETFTGFPATIIQHETDHINGILYTQRVLEQHGKLYKSVTDEDGKDVLEEIRL